jgi:hypothetical protein
MRHSERDHALFSLRRYPGSRIRFPGNTRGYVLGDVPRPSWFCYARYSARMSDLGPRMPSREKIGYIPPVLWTFNTLSFPPSCWNALTSGAATVKTAHCPYVGELAWAPDGAGALTTF